MFLSSSAPLARSRRTWRPRRLGRLGRLGLLGRRLFIGRAFRFLPGRRAFRLAHSLVGQPHADPGCSRPCCYGPRSSWSLRHSEPVPFDLCRLEDVPSPSASASSVGMRSVQVAWKVIGTVVRAQSSQRVLFRQVSLRLKPLRTSLRSPHCTQYAVFGAGRPGNRGGTGRGTADGLSPPLGALVRQNLTPACGPSVPGGISSAWTCASIPGGRLCGFTCAGDASRGSGTG